VNASGRRNDPRVLLDGLIDFHEAHTPHLGQRIPVRMTPTAVARMLGRAPRPDFPAEFEYRGRIIVATTVDEVALRFLGGSL
jgi:hypothetical protein